MISNIFISIVCEILVKHCKKPDFLTYLVNEAHGWLQLLKREDVVLFSLYSIYSYYMWNSLWFGFEILCTKHQNNKSLTQRVAN